jgi:hypothetical protein
MTRHVNAASARENADEIALSGYAQGSERPGGGNSNGGDLGA